MMRTTLYKTVSSLLQEEKIRTLIAHTVAVTFEDIVAQFVELVLHHGSKQPEIGTSNNALSYDLRSE